MTELNELSKRLRLYESLYADAKRRRDHISAKLAAEEMARVNHLVWLVELQEAQEKKT